MQPLRLSAGFTMLELLISVVVLAIGLLGLAGLQTFSLKQNHDAQLRSVALIQANAMIDRMRANESGINAGNYNSISGIPSQPSCGSTCTPAQVAQLDAFEWNTNNASLLPLGQGRVTNGGGNLFSITVMWDNDRSGATGTNCSGNPSVDLTCITLSVQL